MKKFEVREIRKDVYEVTVIIEGKTTWLDVLKEAAKILMREVMYFESHH